MPYKRNQTTTIGLLYSGANGFSTVEACVFGTLIFCLSVFTVASNAVVIHLTRMSSELRPLGPLCLLIGSMAWGDLFMGLIIMPLTGIYNVVEEWLFGEFACRGAFATDRMCLFRGTFSYRSDTQFCNHVYHGLPRTAFASGINHKALWVLICIELVCGTSTTFHLVAIAIDRYLAIMHPIMHKSLGRGYAHCLIAITWLLSLATMVPTWVFKWTRFWREDGRDQCEVPQNSKLALILPCIVVGIPYCTVWIIYSRLYCMNRKRLSERISKTLKTYQDISRNTNNSYNLDEEMKSESEEEKLVRSGCMPQISLILRPNLQGTRICLGCNAKIPVSGIRSGLCMVCRSPNDLLAAAMQSRIKMFLKMNRKTLFVTLIVTCTFTVCYVPIATQFQIAAFCPTCETNARLTTTLVWIAFGMSALDPIIYGVFNANFRRALKKFFNC